MSKSKNESVVAHNNDYVAYNKEDPSNALILTSTKKKVEKKVEKVEQPTISREMLKKIAKLEDKKVRKAERFKSLEIINDQTVDDADRVLLSKSAKLGSKMTMKERMAYAFQAGKHNMSVSVKDATRLENKLVDEGDYAAAYEYLDKKAGKTMQVNPFAHMNSSHASLQNIVYDSSKQASGGKRMTRMEINKHVNNMEMNLEKDVHYIKQQKRRLRRLENQMIRDGTTDVSVLPGSMESIKNILPGKVVSVKTGINPANMRLSTNTSAVASIRHDVSGTAALALAALQQGTVHGKKRKQVIDTLFDMDNTFDNDDDEEEEEEKKVAMESKEEELVSGAKHMGIPVIMRTDKATKLSRNIPVAVYAGSDNQENNNNPYALSGFKVLSAKGAVKRAAMAAKLATLDEKSRRRILKQNNRQNMKFMGGSEYDLADISASEDESSSEEEEEEEKSVRFESWKLVEKMQDQPLKSNRKVLFSASNGPVKMMTSTQNNTNMVTSQANHNQDMNDEEGYSSDEEDEDASEEDKESLDAMMNMLLGLGEGDEGDEGDDLLGEGEEDDEDMELEEDEEEMIMYDDNEEEESAAVEAVEDEILPPRKGVRFDGSNLSFQDLLKRVQADLAGDSEEEKVQPATKKVKAVAPTAADVKVKLVKMTDAPAPAVVNSKKTIITVNRKPEIENSRLQLPVCGQEQEIMEAIMYNDVVILSGETGSGKTTQVPQFLYESGYALDGYIAVTQPRRVAAMSSAKRVGEELNDDTGLVGYQIRYDSQIGPNTRIKMMTEGVLLREIQFDFLLRKYSVVIIDEAHERGLNTDVLLGLLSRICVLRNKLVASNTYKTSNTIGKEGTSEIDNLSTALDGGLDNSLKHGINTSGVTGGKLKIIIMSATLRTTDFTQNPHLFPIPPPIVAVQSRQYPVSMHFSRITEHNYVQKALQKVIRIHTRLPPGGILVFLTGKHEIEVFCKQLSEIFPQPKPGQDNSVDSYVKLGVSNLKTKALRQLKQSGQALNMNDTKVQKLVLEEMKLIKQAAKDKVRSKIMYSKGQPFSMEEIQNEKFVYELVDVSDEAKMMEIAKDVLEQKIQRIDEEVKEGDKPIEMEEFELSDDDDYESHEESEQEMTDSDDATSDEDDDAKYVTDCKNRKVKVKEGETVLETETKTGTSIHDKWKAELENIKQQQVKPPMLVLPLYALLSPEQQMMVFKHDEYSHGARLVVISTNVAETSVTIPGIKYVVDSGREKRKVYEQTTGSSRFEVGFIAQSSANQRAGRAGRTGPGHCYRLYSGAVFDEHFVPHTVPEILRQPIESTVLQMKSMGIRDVARFPFPTPPAIRTVQVACHTLYLLNALQQMAEELTRKKTAEYNRMQKLEEKTNLAGYKGHHSTSSSSSSSSGFAIQAPKKAWQLSQEDAEEQDRLKKALEAAKHKAKEDVEKEEALRAMEARDHSFCVHGQEFIDTTSLNITDIGKAMAVFPLHPRYSKILQSAANQPGCLPLAVIITSALTINEMRVKPAILKFHEKDEEKEESESEESEDETKGGPFDATKMDKLSEEEQNTLIREKLAVERAKLKQEKKEKSKALKTQQSEKMKQMREKWDASCVKWNVEQSDLLTNQRIIGGYLHTRHAYALKQWKALEKKGVQPRKERSYDSLPLYARPAINKKMQEFCDENFIRAKAMSEVLLLREQLTHLVRQRIVANTNTSELFKNDKSKVCIGDGDIDEIEEEDKDEEDSLDESIKKARLDALHMEILNGLQQKVVPPPTEEQEVALCQIIATGFLDKVARRMTDDMKEQCIKNWKQFSLVPQARFYPKDIKHKLKSDHITAKDKAELVSEVPLNIRDLENAYEDLMTGEPVFLAPDSVMSNTDVSLVVYTDMSKDVGRRRKTVISGLTSVSEEWMHLLASPLCAKSRPLEEPMPIFDSDADQVKCFVTATLGPNLWELPLVATAFEDELVEEIVQVQGKSQMKRFYRKPFVYFRHLARLIMEGYVFPKLRTMRPFYAARPMSIMNTPMPPNAFALIDELTRKKITGVKDCKHIWYGDAKTKANPMWLFEEVSAWVHSAKKVELKKIWPPIGKYE